MIPHLVRWDREFREKGLTVLYVHNGAADSKEEAFEHAREERMAFPVGWDELAKTANAYLVRSYPASVLIGRDGDVIWAGDPHPAEESEKRVRKALGVATRRVRV